MSSAVMAEGARGSAFGKADLFISTNQNVFATDVLDNADTVLLDYGFKDTVSFGELIEFPPGTGNYLDPTVTIEGQIR